ncbi:MULTISPECIES: [FeFe] hydrogenase H-cluster radical SAM maturase HydE [Clostridium]|uniref:Biotin synthase n=3 Tax=Clostridium TaxID=1485 RepID=D8GUI1_CLOLD|nr:MULTISPECIES: [FeFe] hydrogenase H-cluster radical SAM maturase HydE [Clostridium]ADK16858.1 putative biotin synthase [Clostridium ljungdahlii DSM 13528]OAA85597.1 Biotin synthase [Clostridium ljungdahlii DSM 13528]OAA92968.1 Biotin synthase [Clostridium coskatii]OBR90490.1 biotin synthase [Clostridium coskatii]RMD00480.1 [FeFe] hydrogenase H-cluster radical SAM maturase HydE [Clostridium autoethanogenum]
MGDKLLESIEKAELNHTLDKSEIVELFNSNEHNEELFKAADRVRKKYVGDEVHLRGLIEFSNICKRNCMYCGLRRDNKNIKRYRIEPDKIIELAKKAVGYGYKTVVLQSGEDDYYTVDKLKYIISNMKKMDIAVTLSIGEKTFEEYKAFKEAGADRYLIRIETTDPELYAKMDPGMSYENRKRCLKDLGKLGYEVGTGCLIGLPGQTFESLAEDILFFKEIDADMVGVGPFIPNADTPLRDEKGGTFINALKVMAISRLIMPDINLPGTTAMETLNPRGRTIALQSGANVVMPNVTEGVYRKLYALYPGKICTGDTPAQCRDCITGKIITIGRVISGSKGFRVKK